jgi:class 3 adenylate cyclase
MLLRQLLSRHRLNQSLETLLSDLVGSTALSVRMDPEDLREVISAYQKCIAETASAGS